jgi:hypothetical protein
MTIPKIKLSQITIHVLLKAVLTRAAHIALKGDGEIALLLDRVMLQGAAARANRTVRPPSSFKPLTGGCFVGKAKGRRSI